jgi:hypothetical protein
MMEFFVEGGWGMFPVLVMGLLLVGAGVRFAIHGQPIRLWFIATLALTLLVTVAHATWTCLAAVLRFLETVEPAQFRHTLLVGLRESTHPATLGGALLSLSLVLVTLGIYRAGQRELALSRAGTGAVKA